MNYPVLASTFDQMVGGFNGLVIGLLVGLIVGAAATYWAVKKKWIDPN